MLRYFTVEYDGYTYKKEEVKEEKRGPGVQYLVNALTLTTSERIELEKIISRMNTKSKWKDLSDKQERIYLKMEKILSRLRAYTPFSLPFLSKVSKREAPEYYNLIKTPIDLGKIGKKLSMQEYSDVNDFSKDLDLIWENCFKFNNTHGNIYAMYAQKMKEKSLVLLQDLFSEREIELEGSKEEMDYLIRTEKQRKEMVATRAAILQNPAEFTYRRTAEAMGEYWKEETKKIEEIEQEKEYNILEENILQPESHIDSAAEQEKKPYPLYFPEYHHFYNSFPVDGLKTNILPFSIYTIDDIYMEEHTVYSRNSKTHRLGEKAEQEKKLFYTEGVYQTKDGTKIEDIHMGRSEVLHLLKRIIMLELVSVGFTNSEASALNIFVSYIMHRVESAMKQISEYRRRSSYDSTEKMAEDTMRQIVHMFQLKTVEAQPPQFFSEDEEETDEESIINIIYSNTEDADIELDDDLI